MIQRRQFIGGLGASCLVTGPLAKLVLASPQLDELPGDLNWRCDVIKTIPHDSSQRSPVVTGVALQPAGSQLAIVGDDHHVSLYDTVGQTYLHHLAAHHDWIRDTRFSVDGSLLATAGNDRTVKIWTVGEWQFPRITKTHQHAIIQVAFSHDSKTIATVGFEPQLRIYDLDSGQQTLELACACDDNHAVSFSADDQWIAAGGRSGVIRIWNARTGKKQADINAHRQRIRSLEFTEDGQLISAGDDQIVTVTDLSDPARPHHLPRQVAKIFSLAILNDGLLAIGGSDNRIHVWQQNPEKAIGTLEGHTGTVSSLSFSDGRLASGSFDTHVRLWHTVNYTSAPLPRQTQQGKGWNERLK